MIIENKSTKYIVNDDIAINYYYKNNNKDKLIVAFQANGPGAKMSKLFQKKNKENNITDIEYLELQDKYQKGYTSFKQYDDIANVLLIEDNFFNKDEDKIEHLNISWFYKCKGIDLTPILRDFISKVQRQMNFKPSNTILLGTSKGAYAVLHLANEGISELCIPMFITFYTVGRVGYNADIERVYYDYNFHTNEMNIEELQNEMVNSVVTKAKKFHNGVHIVAGICDDQTNELFDKIALCTSANIYLNKKFVNHNILVVEAEKIVKDILKNGVLTFDDYQKIK